MAAQPTTRSRISNGASLLPTSDGRSIWARLMRDTYAALIAHCGGDNLISDTRRMTARRVACLEAELVFLEDMFAGLRERDETPSTDSLALYGTLSDRQRRLAEVLGWDRKARDVAPEDLNSYVAERARRKHASYEVMED